MSESVITVTSESLSAPLGARLGYRVSRCGRGYSIRERKSESQVVFAVAHPRGRRHATVEWVAQAVADSVIRDWEPHFIDSVLRFRFPSLMTAENSSPGPLLSALLRPPAKLAGERLWRRDALRREIADFLREESDHLVVEGFLSFRALEYRRSLLQSVDRAALPWIRAGRGVGPGADDEEMDLVFRVDGLAFLVDARGSVLMGGRVDDADLANLVVDYLVHHEVSMLTVHDPSDWWGSWVGTEGLLEAVEDLDACFGCTLCLGVRSSR